MRAYSKKDVDKKALKGARIAILGYGSQGRAHALNLKDSGLRRGRGRPHDRRELEEGAQGWPRGRRARRCGQGRRTGGPAGARPGAAGRLQGHPPSRWSSGAALLFAHGFNMHFKQIRPRKDLDVVLIAPKGPGDLVRRQFQQGRGVPCLIAVGQDATGKAHAKALAYADGIGGTRGGRHRDDVCRGNRDRSVRRTGRALRRRHRAGGEGLSKRWSRPATSPKSLTTSACTS